MGPAGRPAAGTRPAMGGQPVAGRRAGGQRQPKHQMQVAITPGNPLHTHYSLTGALWHAAIWQTAHTA